MSSIPGKQTAAAGQRRGVVTPKQSPRPNLNPRRGGRRAVPTVLQMEKTECGAACLAMILAHYGRWEPLEELRVRCGVSRDGTKALNVIRVGEEFGMLAGGKQARVGRLLELRFPDDRVLELQPFRGAGGDARRPRLDQRSGRGAAHSHQGRVRRELLRHLSRLRTRPRVSQGGQAGEYVARSLLTTGPRARAVSLRHPGDACADRPRPRTAGDSEGVRGRCADPAQRHVDDSAADRTRARRVRAGGTHMAPAGVPRAHGDQARHRRHHAFLHASLHSADDLLPPALRR